MSAYVVVDSAVHGPEAFKAYAEKVGAILKAHGGKPIANNVMDLAASGGHWYGLDKARRVYSGDLGRYIDRDGDAAAVTAIGRDLLLFTRDTKLYRFRMADRRWEGSND